MAWKLFWIFSAVIAVTCFFAPLAVAVATHSVWLVLFSLVANTIPGVWLAKVLYEAAGWVWK